MSIQKSNYEQLQSIIKPCVQSGETVHFKSGGLMDLNVTRLWVIGQGVSVYTMDHHWILNGDFMYDPAMEFVVDDNEKCVKAVSWTLSGLGLYQSAGNPEERLDPRIVARLDVALRDWLNTIAASCYELHAA